ncbi:MAG: P-loop ATPase, Sll1717 family [Planctomycetota bacterium]|jgi:hypothetical protein
MNETNKEFLKRVDFGDIDGLYDARLEDYFLDFGYWNDIGHGRKCFVIGRKGTGKSALYSWIKHRESQGDILVANLSFKDFPFEKLLQLSDDAFAKPNQYQTIWRNIIFSELALMIVGDTKSTSNEIYGELLDYVKQHFGANVSNLHKEITRLTKKKGGELKIGFTRLGGEKSCEQEIGDGSSNITLINRRLETLVQTYLQNSKSSKLVVQFDQLDDNYTTYIKKHEYFQCIISLFKVVYDVNQTFRSMRITAKVVVYIRSDIYNRVDKFDAESARWEPFKLNLNFAIISRLDWRNPKLLQILNRRISCSVEEMRKVKNPFASIFSPSMINLKDYGRDGRERQVHNIFKYIIHRTFHRPRDVIQFCIKIQEQVRETDTFFFRTIKNGEERYALWLLSEIANEVGPIISELNVLYELLRLMGRGLFSMLEFKRRYARYRTRVKMDEEELLKFLYDVGIIFNVNVRRQTLDMFSIVRNDRSVFNRDLKIQIHPGVARGLYLTKFAPIV